MINFYITFLFSRKLPVMVHVKGPLFFGQGYINFDKRAAGDIPVVLNNGLAALLNRLVLLFVVTCLPPWSGNVATVCEEILMCIFNGWLLIVEIVFSYHKKSNSALACAYYF